MKAVQLIETGKPLEMREVPLPHVGERDVRMRVKAAGICHSDVHYRSGISPVGSLPQTLGHMNSLKFLHPASKILKFLLNSCSLHSGSSSSSEPLFRSHRFTRYREKGGPMFWTAVAPLGSRWYRT